MTATLTRPTILDTPSPDATPTLTPPRIIDHPDLQPTPVIPTTPIIVPPRLIRYPGTRIDIEAIIHAYITGLGIVGHTYGINHGYACALTMAHRIRFGLHQSQAILQHRYHLDGVFSPMPLDGVFSTITTDLGLHAHYANGVIAGFDGRPASVSSFLTAVAPSFLQSLLMTRARSSEPDRAHLAGIEDGMLTFALAHHDAPASSMTCADVHPILHDHALRSRYPTLPPVRSR